MDWIRKAWAWLKGFGEYLTTFEPAMLRGVWVALVGLLASLGILVTPALNEKVDAIIGVIIAILAILQGYWTRKAVVPAVVAENDRLKALYTEVPDPVVPVDPDLGDVQDDEWPVAA